jgi:membrane protein
MRVSKISVFLRSAKIFFADKYSYQASALAFTTLLTLVPVLAVAVYILRLMPFFNKLFVFAKQYVFMNFVPTSSVVIEKQLNVFSEQAGALPTGSIAFLVASILMLVLLVKNCINDIWGSPQYKSPILRAAHFLMILVTPIFVAAGMYLSSFFWMSFITPVIINALCFGLLYIVMPSCHVEIADGVVGGLVAAILFEIAKVTFVLYMQLFPSYQLIYGALAVIPIFLLWLYISWSIIIYGAIVSKVSATS